MSRLLLSDCVDLLCVADRSGGDIARKLGEMVRDELISRYPLPIVPIDYRAIARDTFKKWLIENQSLDLPEFSSGSKLYLVKRLRNIMKDVHPDIGGLLEAKNMVEKDFKEWIIPSKY